MIPIFAACAATNAITDAIVPDSAKSDKTKLTPAQVEQFQKLMQGMKDAGLNVNDLMAMSGQQLQQKIGTLTPDQQRDLAEKLFGAQVTVQDPTGTQITGHVDNVHIEGKSPSIDVAGINYTLDKLQAIKQI